MQRTLSSADTRTMNNKKPDNIALEGGGDSEPLLSDVELTEKGMKKIRSRDQLEKSDSPNVSNSKTAPIPMSSRSMSILSCLLYTAMSVSMVLVNKAISAQLDSEVRKRLPDFSIIFTQCIVAVFLVYGARLFRIVDFPDFSLATALRWLPVNILFVGMLCSGFISLTYVNVPMATVLKNMTNIFTIAGDWYLFNGDLSLLIILSVSLMTMGAVMAGLNDLQYTFKGYVWTGLNCLFTSSYILYMRYASSSINLPRFGMVAYNNVLSAAILFPLCFLDGEMFSNFPDAFKDTGIYHSFFIWSVILTGCIGFGLNFASLWCVSSTSATTYAIVGTLNKIPITVLGYFLFDTVISSAGAVFIFMATLGGMLYGYAKLPK